MSWHASIWMLFSDRNSTTRGLDWLRLELQLREPILRELANVKGCLVGGFSCVFVTNGRVDWTFSCGLGLGVCEEIALLVRIPFTFFRIL